MALPPVPLKIPENGFSRNLPPARFPPMRRGGGKNTKSSLLNLFNNFNFITAGMPPMGNSH